MFFSITMSSYPSNDSLKRISSELSQLTLPSQQVQLSPNSVRHIHMQKPEYNYMHNQKPTGDLRHYHNGLPKPISSCPNSFQIQEEKLLTTLV